MYGLLRDALPEFLAALGAAAVIETVRLIVHLSVRRRPDPGQEDAD
ncbi:hypothetical protein P8605_18045 [Streptomyces sp. T-3]|nr:hypothetical protein [Streptomyces sp. T-3]